MLQRIFQFAFMAAAAFALAGCHTAPRPARTPPPVATSRPHPPAPVPPILESNNDPLKLECKKWLGTRYQLGGASHAGVDCSGFTSQVYLNVFNVKLPRTAAGQFTRGRNINTTELKPGDLVFFQTSAEAPVTHVGIYLGDGQFEHSSTRYGVIISRLFEGYYSQAFRGAKRILPPPSPSTIKP